MADIVYLVQDLFFSARIEETARQLGLAAEKARDVEGLCDSVPGARVAIVDLRLPDALRALDLLAADPRAAAVRTIGFVDHENVDVMQAASARGCGTVLSKRRFANELSALLSLPPA
jgi:hypothetical protein